MHPGGQTAIDVDGRGKMAMHTKSVDASSLVQTKQAHPSMRDTDYYNETKAG